jgi:hypothetical protein
MGGGERPFAEPFQNAVAKRVSRRAILTKPTCNRLSQGKNAITADTQNVDLRESPVRK